MGPLSGAAQTGWKIYLSERHGKCREKEKCTGPGCKLHTGKTQDNREKGKSR